MTKNYYILLLLVCISICKSDKVSPKNLRKLEQKKLTFSRAENLVAEDTGLKFDVIIGETSILATETDYSLTILCNSDKIDINKINKVSATCRYSQNEGIHKLECKYDGYGAPYYGLIQLPKSTNIQSTDTISLQLTSEVTLKQNVDLTYKKTEIEYISSGTAHYNLQIHATGNALSNGAFYQVDISKDSKNIIGNCTYSTTTTYLSCDFTGTNSVLIKLLKDKTNGSVNWSYTGTSIDFEKTQLLKFTVGYVLGYNSIYESSKWTFSLLESSCNIHKAGYYFSIKVLLDKDEGSDVTALAICNTTDKVYHQTCEIEKILEPLDGTQEQNDLVYLTANQEGSTFSVRDTSLNANKIISREMDLTFEKVYELKYESSKWHFKIGISDEGLRNGLNVTVDTLYGNTYIQGTCTHQDKVLSCIREKSQGGQDEELIYLSFEKRYGSITWNGRSSGKTKIPLWNSYSSHP